MIKRRCHCYYHTLWIVLKHTESHFSSECCSTLELIMKHWLRNSCLEILGPELKMFMVWGSHQPDR